MFILLAAGPVSASAKPGDWTQAQVNKAIKKGVAYLDTARNSDGSFGTIPFADTGIALTAYGVLANGNFNSLPAKYRTHVKKAISFLLSSQSKTDGSWADSGEFFTYSTSIALSGLSAFKAVNKAIPKAISKGRHFLVKLDFQGSARTGCNSGDNSSTAFYCGGWNYDPEAGRSDESNTGWALTGLFLSGGVPTSIRHDNINWQHHVQSLKGNPFSPTANDGGGSYTPSCADHNCTNFSSNANDSGSVLFGLGFDGVPGSDKHVAAAVKFGNDVLNTYEKALPTRNMVYHTGTNEDGSCNPAHAGCTWSFGGTSEGGYHYSIFALTKGLGEYIAPRLTNPRNWYAKVADLLLGSQGTDGSWPQDGRDDGDSVFASALAVSSLGLVAVPPSKIVKAYAGYADSFRSGSHFPSPWRGGKNVIFEGCNYFHPSRCRKSYDSGAIRLVNTGTRVLTVSNASVRVGSCTFRPWPGLNVKMPGGRQLILTQTGGKPPCHTNGPGSRANFDASETGHSCTKNDGLIPIVHVTVSGTALTYRDTSQVINTGGVDRGAPRCGGHSETHDWRPIRLKK
ncbi:MAG TPA: prenyltransferase/squalene oxidase repeat-containing protein [Solirubrobacteraceae bacterium]|nr:prenyltransferase/squalene oxidase repeat-containing protein [Solirubrobacteraceae bacterium]